ncbi:MAG: hypothetical protein ACRD6N_09240 [Pyrinomonadaceae bacterium]
MKLYQLLLIACLFLLYSSAGLAQDPPSAQKDAATLRMQLTEVQAKEEELKTRVKLLEQEMQPENIERSLAGIGSTKPEELREQRRRQLEIQKISAEAQLEQLAISRARLEATIATADALAYQQSAKGYPSQQLNQVGGMQSRITLRWILIAGLVGVLGIAAVFLLARRLLRNNI